MNVHTLALGSVLLLHHKGVNSRMFTTRILEPMHPSEKFRDHPRHTPKPQSTADWSPEGTEDELIPFWDQGEES